MLFIILLFAEKMSYTVVSSIGFLAVGAYILK